MSTMRSSDEWDSAGERTHSWGDDDPDPDWLQEIEDQEDEERSKHDHFAKVDLETKTTGVIK